MLAHALSISFFTCTRLLYCATRQRMPPMPIRARITSARIAGPMEISSEVSEQTKPRERSPKILHSVNRRLEHLALSGGQFPAAALFPAVFRDCGRTAIQKLAHTFRG